MFDIIWLDLPIFILALAGIYMEIRFRTQMPDSLIPATMAAGIIVYGVFCGMLNILPHSVLGLVCSGLALLVWQIASGPRRTEIFKCSWLHVLFLLLCGVIVFYLHGRVFMHYDNFSHWGVIAKHIYMEDTLPSYKSGFVTFQSYPPGSAIFIYYMLQGFGFSEANALIAHALLLLSFAWVLTGVLPKRGKWIWAVVFLGYLVYCCFNIVTIRDLLVDIVLASCGLAGSIAILSKAEYKGKGITVALLMASCMMIKSSGVYFVAINTVLLLYQNGKLFRRQQLTPQVFCKLICIIAFPLVVNMIWDAHVDMVFNAGDTSKHAMSAENYLKIFGQKTPEDLVSIIINYCLACASDSVLLTSIAIMNISLLACVIIQRLRGEGIQAKHLLKSLAFIDICVIAYLIGTLGMYFFSMPLGEAEILAGRERYHYSFLIWSNGLALYVIMKSIAQVKKIVDWKYAVTLFAAIAVSVYAVSYAWPNINVKQNTMRFDKCSNAVQGITPDRDNRMLVYQNDYEYYYLRYLLWSPNVDISWGLNENAVESYLSRYRWLLIFKDNEELAQIISPYLEGDDYTGCFEIRKEDQGIRLYMINDID